MCSVSDWFEDAVDVFQDVIDPTGIWRDVSSEIGLTDAWERASDSVSGALNMDGEKEQSTTASNASKGLGEGDSGSKESEDAEEEKSIVSQGENVGGLGSTGNTETKKKSAIGGGYIGSGANAFDGSDGSFGFTSKLGG